ncbi:MAG: S8 family serine peptidase [Pseudomonadota bacterium]|nr:S8 family serine peptidase [Pseudomonadota bacterium]
MLKEKTATMLSLKIPQICHSLVAALAFSLSLACTEANGAKSDPVIAGEVLVKLRTASDLGALLTRYGLSEINRFGQRPIFRLRLPASANMTDVLAALQLDASVLIAEPNVIHGTPEGRKNAVWAIGNAQVFAQQWAPAALRLSQAHLYSTGSGVTVAVLDTGVDRAHPLLASRLLPGYDFVDGDNDPSEEGSRNDAGYGHGTHVAGLIAMVAPGARIMPLRVLEPSGQGNTWVLAEALLYAVDPDGNPATDDGAHVINLSLGTTTRTRILDAVTQLVTCTAVTDDPAFDLSDAGYATDADRCSHRAGVVIAAAAGNDSTDAVRQYPAAERVHGLLAVAGSDASAHLAPFSNFGSWIGIAAPGAAITSSIPGGGYATWEGTSMAAPLVAGTAALLLARDPNQRPDDLIKRIQNRSALLCGTSLREVDAAAAVQDRSAPATVCH